MIVSQRMGSMGIAAQPCEEIIYRSKLPDIDIPDHLPVHDYCFENLSAVADRPCIIHGETGDVFTYAEVELTARRVAAGLNRLGIRKGDVIIALLPNSSEFVRYHTTANPFCTTAEIQKQAQAARARLVVTQSAYVGKVRELVRLAGVTIVCTDAHIEGCLHFSTLAAANTGEMAEVEIWPDDVVALPYSSGTTGMPKGVKLTHRGQVTSVAQQRRRGAVRASLVPHLRLNSVLLGGLRAGSAILIVPKFDAVVLLDLIQRHRVTVAPLVPPILLALAKRPDLGSYDLSSIRIVMSGAAPMGKDLEEALSAKLPAAKVGQGYGMTEAGPVLSMCLAFAKEPFKVKSGSCGTVVRNAELKIIDPNTGESLPRNQCLRHRLDLPGYLNDPEATARTIDGEGWLHTGDVGYVDDDDEIFILEAMLVAHPGIADAAVVPMKDEAAGEVPVAFVVRSGSSAVSENGIMEFISAQVVFYKRIKRVFFVEAIPKAPSGKILRKNLRAILADGFAGASRN
ncbi:unnamed protein product [Spirodela intermedia]|uniref:4-coumarate--CoA ligase n=1 Tax=Spirodela intermedia TaxID=51605 RepID=A0A7I8JLP7_SPIIN|nr:unnamed protein product [Spirodela intermedia]CAA6671069.1 unnamed protein product [Spirodela intermedia]